MSDPQEREYDYRKQRYEAYSKEREGLRAAALEVSGRYDRWMLFLAGGALALSVTFIEKIAPHPSRWSFVLLLLAWVLLILSLVLELHALAASHTAVQQQVSLLDEDYRQFLNSLSDRAAAVSRAQPTEVASSENEFIFRTRMLNKWALRSLIAGIIFLCLFSAVNLPYSVVMAESQKEIAINASKGSFVPPHNILPPPPPPPAVTTVPPAPSPGSSTATQPQR
jgi:hypothetical protein